MSQTSELTLLNTGPPNTRLVTIAPKDLILLNLWLSLESLAFICCCTLLCIFWSIIYIFGIHVLVFITLKHCLVIVFAVCLFTLLMFFVLPQSYKLYKLKAVATQFLHGYTKNYFYGASIYGSDIYAHGVTRWECYTRWKETKAYFLLQKEGLWWIVPKTMWTEDEIAELQAIIKEKIGK